MNNKFLPAAEAGLRVSRLQKMMAECGLDAMVVSTNANVYYLTGCVFSGFVYIPVQGSEVYFVRRPAGLEDSRVVYIKKPEQIVEELQKMERPVPAKVAFELDRLPYSEVLRLVKAFGCSETLNCSPLLGNARAVKTDYEVEKIRESGVRHAHVYNSICSVFRPGMTDCELQIEMERLLRLDGCLGIFRIAGESMELFMGNVITGDNADAPSPYDFAMGGEGMDASLPVGCNGSVIRPGSTLMVDMNGNFTGYMTDMTRSFYVGTLNEMAAKAHNLSIEIHNRLKASMKPGTAAKDAYNEAMAMVEEAGMADYFMGHRQQAGFIGHGVGIEVNEWPVIAPRSRHMIEKGNVIALEPKFVIPGVGAVGVENTYIVTDNGLECLTNFPEEIIEL